MDEATFGSKEMKALNPMGKYPFIETSSGAICGVLPVCKYFCRQAKKLLGSGDAKETAQIDQWTNWVFTSLQPLCEQVMIGVFGGNQIGMQI